MMKDQELKQKWIAALRSGEFKQAQAALRRDDSFCCLGVACVVAGKEIPDVATTSLYSWLRYDMQVPTWELWTMNDSQGLSFPQIADWIEANL